MTLWWLGRFDAAIAVFAEAVPMAFRYGVDRRVTPWLAPTEPLFELGRLDEAIDLEARAARVLGEQHVALGQRKIATLCDIVRGHFDGARDVIAARQDYSAEARVGTLRLVNAAIKSADIDARPKDKISDAEILGVLAKMIKQRRDSIEQFRAGGRPELADKEAAEIVVIEGYMPKQMSEAEAKAAIAAVIKETGAAGPKDIGKVMAALKAKYAGQMDFGKASGITKELLK